MSPPQRERFGRRCDALVHAGMIVLLVFSPLAIGAVHPWSLAIVQAIVAGLVIVWASKALVCGSTAEANDRLRRWRLPLVCFGAVTAVQIVPMPPPLLRVLSPQTFAVYRENLPGWPEQPPFGEIAQTVTALRESTSRPPQVGPLPSVSAAADSDVTTGALLAQIGALAQRLPGTGTWRAVSLYPYRSGAEWLGMLVWAAVFFCSSPTPGIPLRH